MLGEYEYFILSNKWVKASIHSFVLQGIKLAFSKSDKTYLVVIYMDLNLV